MGLLQGLTSNRADTRTPSHPDLAPLAVAHPPADAAAAVVRAVADLPRWAVASAGPGEVHLTRRTRLFRFVDDVRLTFEPGTGGSTRVHAASQSRLGKGDFGQNRRNILELWAALRAAGVSG